MTEEHWLDPAQQHAVAAALTVVRAWADAREDPEAVLLEVLRDQDPARAMVGLATASRLLAIELAACSRRTESAVLADLAERALTFASPTDSRRVAR